MSNWTTLDTSIAAKDAGIPNAPAKLTWTILHRFAQRVAEEAAQRERSEAQTAWELTGEQP